MDGNTSDLAEEQTWYKVGAELRRLREAQGMSLSGLARQVHYSTGYLSKIETGKKRITLEVARLVDEALETGGVLVALLPSPVSLEPVDDEPDPTDTDACPYPGLAAFDQSETRWFFGRDQATSDLISQLDARLAVGGPLAVVAPSGAGKSSLLAAGLIPALACGALPGSRAWPVVTATPGAHPLASLAALVSQRTGANPADAAAATADPERFAAFLTSTVAIQGGKQRETPSSARIVLIVDQFEETFTQCRQEAERQAFIAALCAAAHSAAALVVLGVRADFYGSCLAYPALLTALQSPVALGPMSVDQLRTIITEPAKAECLEVEPGLVELLLRDLGVTEDPGAEASGYDPGTLPLLAHALRVTWQQRSSRLLTVAGYRSTGGLRGAIAVTAERAYTRLSPSEQQIAQQMLLRLVEVGAQAGEVRRRVPRDRLLRILTSPVEVTEKILETFGRARLLTFDTASVQITHEALLRAWPRLIEWISADRAGLRTHQLLSEAAEIWEAEGRDPFLLYRGSRLAIAQDWASGPGRKDQLSELEKVYLETSIDQKQREQQAERLRARRLRKSVGVLAMSLVVALVAGSIAFQQYRTASTQRHQAIVSKLAADSGSLAGKDPAVSMLLAVEAFQQDKHAPETRSALLSAQSQYFAGQLVGHKGILYTAIFSHDGRILATASADGTARLWNAASHQQIDTLPGHRGPVNDVAFSHDDRILVTVGEDGTAQLRDVANRQLIDIITGGPGVAFSAAAFSHDGHILAITEQNEDKSGTVRLWEAVSQPGQPRRKIATLNGHTDHIFSAEFSPDNRLLATASADGTARLWDITTHQSTTFTGHAGRVNNATFSHDGSKLVTVGNDTTAKVWNVATHQLITAEAIRHTGPINDAAFSPDGRILVTGGSDGTAQIWDVATYRRVSTLRGYSSIIGVAFSEDGHTVATASEDNVARLWDTSDPILTPSPPFIGYDAAFSPDGRILATAGADVRMQLWDTTSRLPIASHFGGHAGGAVNSITFSPDGRTLLTTGDDGTARLWNVTSQQAITTLYGHSGVVRSGAFSPDGRILATTDDGGTVRLWDTVSYQPIAPPLVGHTRIVYTAKFSHDGRILATAGADGTARLWDTTSHQSIATLDERTGTINKLAFSPDDRILATANEDGTARLWDIANRRQIVSLRGHASAVKSVTFSRNSQILVTTSGDTTAKLWNVDTHQLIATLAGHTDVVYGAALSPDRLLLATVGGDATVRLWDLNENQVTARICQIIGTVSEERRKGLIRESSYQPACR